MNKKQVRMMITVLVIAYVGNETSRIISLILQEHHKQVEQIRTGRNRPRSQFNGWNGMLKMNLDL